MKIFLRLTGLSALLVSPCAAQDTRVDLSFVSFPRAYSVEPVELLVGPGKTIEVNLPSHTISAPVRVPRLEQWLLGKSAINDKGEFTFEVYGKVNSSASGNQTLVVFRSQEQDKPRYEIVRLDGDAGLAAGGSQFFHNATKANIGVMIGDQTFSLKPDQNKLTKAKASFQRDSREYLSVEFHYQIKDLQKKFESTTWRHNDKVRYMVFFYHDERTKQIGAHMIRSYPKPPIEITIRE